MPRATIAALIMLGAMPLAAAEPVGQIVAMQGLASATAPDGGERDLSLQSAIYLNDTVKTLPGAKVQMMFDDDSIVSQGENSSMVIDEYVYNPGKKDKAAFSMKILDGIFRVITGKITELNPERFKVRTRMATIGIRGCDLGFVVGPNSERVYVLDIHRGEDSVLVEADESSGGGAVVTDGAPSADGFVRRHLSVRNPNRLILIAPGGRLNDRRVSRREIVILIDAVTPIVPDDNEVPRAMNEDPGAHGEAGDLPEDEPGEDNPFGERYGEEREPREEEQPSAGGEEGWGSGAEEAVWGEEEMLMAAAAHQKMVEAALVAGDIDLLLALLDDPLTTPEQRSAIESRLTEIAAIEHQAVVEAAIASGDKDLLVALLTHPLTTPGQAAAMQSRLDGIEIAEHQALVEHAILTGDVPLLQALLNHPLTTSEQRTAIESRLAELSRSFVVKNTGSHWDWGIWHGADHSIESLEARSSAILSATEFDQLAKGAVLYTLSGVGDAAATIRHGGELRLVQGYADTALRAANGVTGFGCILNVQLGQSVVPAWTGQFSMDNSLGDSLVFEVMGGTMRTDGLMMGTPDYYYMNVHGTPFDRNTITSENISGVLVGPGGGAPPSGTVGAFTFSHGAAALADGVFAADIY